MPDPSNASYTAHASGASAVAAALSTIGAWGFSLIHVDVPLAVAMAATVVFTPIVSMIFKRFGVLSA